MEKIVNDPGDLGKSARHFIEAAAKFIEELAKHNVELDFGENDDTSNTIDYDNSDSVYQKSYKPIKTTEIVKANQEMSQAISGERFTKGFLVIAKLFLLLS